GLGSARKRCSARCAGDRVFAHLDTSGRIGGRDPTCPARLQGLRDRLRTTANILPAETLAIGTDVMGATASTDCWHTVGQPFNDRPGGLSHLGLATAYSNVGTLTIPVGVKVFPLKGHEITGWYAYRGIVNPRLMEIAFAPELRAQGKSHIGKTIDHEVGAYWFWTLNPNFDIRLSGNLGFAGNASKDLAELSDCNLNAPGIQRCHGKDVALKAEARFRARF